MTGVPDAADRNERRETTAAIRRIAAVQAIVLAFASSVPLSVLAIVVLAVTFAPAVSAESLQLIGVLTAISAVLLGTAGSLWTLKARLSSHVDSWKLTLLVVELMLVTVGYGLAIITGVLRAKAGPSALGTNGPFADGMEGALDVVLLAWLSGLPVVALIVVEAGTLLWSRLPRS